MKHNLLGAVSITALGAALSMGVATTASAVPVTLANQTITLNPGTPTQSISFATFNGALGTLTSVTLTMAANDTIIGRVSDVGAAPVSYGTPTPLTSTGTFTTTGPVALSATQTLTTTIGAASSGTLNPGQFGVTYGTGSAPAFSTSTTLNPPPTDLSAYINNGVTTYSVSLTGVTNQNGSCVFPCHAGTSYSGTVTIGITYNYTPVVVGVPEPASLALLGVGLAGIGALRRRRAA